MQLKNWGCDQKEGKEYQLRSRPSLPVVTKNSVLMRIEGRHKDDRCHDSVYVTETKTRGSKVTKRSRRAFEVATGNVVIREITRSQPVIEVMTSNMHEDRRSNKEVATRKRSHDLKLKRWQQKCGCNLKLRSQHRMQQKTKRARS